MLEAHLTTHPGLPFAEEAQGSPTMHRTKRSTQQRPSFCVITALSSERARTAGPEEAEQPPLLLSVTAHRDVCWEERASAGPALGWRDGLDDLSCQRGSAPLTHSWTSFCWVKFDLI